MLGAWFNASQLRVSFRVLLRLLGLRSLAEVDIIMKLEIKSPRITIGFRV